MVLFWVAHSSFSLPGKSTLQLVTPASGRLVGSSREPRLFESKGTDVYSPCS